MTLDKPENPIDRDIIEIDAEKCDGCGQCLISCAEGALALVDGRVRLVSDKYCDGLGACLGHCPTGALKIITRPAPAFTGPAPTGGRAADGPGLTAWPIQLRLISPAAPAYDHPELILAADCTAFAAPSFQAEFLEAGRPLVIACPKLDDFEDSLTALTNLLTAQPRLEEIIIPMMSVPCCGGLGRLAGLALRKAGRPEVRLRHWIVGPDGRMNEEAIR